MKARRPVPALWRKHFAELRQQLIDGEQLIEKLEQQAAKVSRDCEHMRAHVMTSVAVFGDAMKNPRLSANGQWIEGD